MSEHIHCRSSFLTSVLGSLAATANDDGGGSDAESTFRDDASIFSENSFWGGDEGNEEGGNNKRSAEAVATADDFEDKLAEALDGCTQKSAKDRTKAIRNVNKGLMYKMAPEFVESQ